MLIKHNESRPQAVGPAVCRLARQPVILPSLCWRFRKRRAFGGGRRGRILKTSIQKVRRNDLVEAAFATFLEYGLNGMTMARIGERAGMSHGIVNYYFKNKDQLLSEVVRKANYLIMQDVARRLREARSPRARLSAVVVGNFPADLFTRNVARAWVSFYAAIGGMPEFESLQVMVYRRLRSNLVATLKQLTTDVEAERIALGISVWIDGLWLRQATDREAMTPETAIAAVEHYIDIALATAPSRPSNRPVAPQRAVRRKAGATARPPGKPQVKGRNR